MGAFSTGPTVDIPDLRLQMYSTASTLVVDSLKAQERKPDMRLPAF